MYIEPGPLRGQLTTRLALQVDNEVAFYEYMTAAMHIKQIFLENTDIIPPGIIQGGNVITLSMQHYNFHPIHFKNLDNEGFMEFYYDPF